MQVKVPKCGCHPPNAAYLTYMENQLDEFQPQLHYRKEIAEIEKRPSEAVVQRCSVEKFLKETLAHVCSCEFCEISKKTFFHRTPLVSASGLSDQEQYTRIECVGLAGLSTDLHGDQLEDHIVGVFQTTCMEVNKFSRNPPTEKQESCNSETSEPARRHERKEEVAGFGRR